MLTSLSRYSYSLQKCHFDNVVAGLVWSLRPNDIDVQLLTVSRQLMQSLEAETGLHPGWINNGGLFIASTKERLDEYKRLMTVGTVHNKQMHGQMAATACGPPGQLSL